MKKTILLLVMLLLSNLSLISVNAIDEKKPSLSVIYLRETDAINPGDIIRFDVFFPGDGKINLVRCSFYYNGDLFDEIFYKDFDNPNKNVDVKVPAYTFLLNNTVFQNIEGEPWYTTPAEIGASSENGKVVAPIRLWLDTKSDIPPGDHFITLVLSYTDDNEWYLYEKNLEFHVNNFYEQYQTIIVILGIIGTIGTILGFIKFKRKKNAANQK